MNRQSWVRLFYATWFATTTFILLWAIQPPEPFGYDLVSWVVISCITLFVFFALLRLQEIERQLEHKQMNKPKQIQFRHVKLRDGNKW